MKLLIPFFILLFSFCNFKKHQTNPDKPNEKKEPDILLLKLTWFEGEVQIQRNNTNLTLQTDLELEKEDLISTGKNGTLELQLGIENYIKLKNNTEITVANLLTTNGETVTNVSIQKGEALFYSNNENEELTIITPNAIAKTKNSIVLLQIVPSSIKGKDLACNKTNCSTKIVAANGNLQIKQVDKESEIVLEKNNQLLIGQNELEQKNIEKIDMNSLTELKTLLAFHTTDVKVDPNMIDNYKPERTTSPILKKHSTLIPKKVVLTKSRSNPIKKNIPSKKAVNLKKPALKDSYKDKLKLQSNKKF